MVDMIYDFVPENTTKVVESAKMKPEHRISHIKKNNKMFQKR